MAVTMSSWWGDAGTEPPAMYSYTATQPIADYDNWINYSLVSDIQAVIDEVINRYGSNTILKADIDHNPIALTVGEQAVVGRKSGGNIDALPIGIVDDDIVQIDSATVTDNDYAKFTANGLEGRSFAEVRSDINVEDGATADQTKADIEGLGIDHGALSGIADDDHTQYLLADGTRDLGGNWNPDGDGTRKIGDATHRLSEIHAIDGIFGDLIFEEQTCPICGKKLEVGQILSSIVTKISDNGTHTVPVHLKCIMEEI